MKCCNPVVKMAMLEGKEFGDPDLILLDKVTEEAANTNLKLRFEKGKVSGSILQFKCNELQNHRIFII